jgi:hypothetical protein
MKLIPALALLVAALISLTPSKASADSSCDALFAKVRDQASREFNGVYQNVYFLWATTYFVPDLNARFTATARGQFKGYKNANSSVNNVLTAWPIKRTETYYDPYLNVTSQKISTMQVDLEGGNKLALTVLPDPRFPSFSPTGGVRERFGPFDPHCLGDKSAIIDSGDSIEVLMFAGSGPPAKLSLTNDK